MAGGESVSLRVVIKNLLRGFALAASAVVLLPLLYATPAHAEVLMLSDAVGELPEAVACGQRAEADPPLVRSSL
ncbi:hypothetical protein GCM10011583_71540 [Streptomyces camponoticapitis]|uniref:Uncharacterized protein n=1 Tax=Streptomyces camponoticapitis TaxID=1616125 RepID=A0ABQ2EX79_9ACTN|nr:hypothetical protein GCM10011583_71540 [Streptomyces camponoticapitis]